ncbi:hypothetical protein Tco_0419643, partial [Tanacetum coccineum]
MKTAYISASLFELPVVDSGIALSISLSIGTKVCTLIIVVSNRYHQKNNFSTAVVYKFPCA